jgi:hypothetical protein
MKAGNSQTLKSTRRESEKQRFGTLGSRVAATTCEALFEGVSRIGFTVQRFDGFTAGLGTQKLPEAGRELSNRETV